ncbi:zinc-finger homeodomain protein 8-like [Musa acuminata AAA Group]|uniref:zinc-finger homeodomain protein 8-like n=1 Tax=Musa acuminata AAA Group TaxID=214697 RepID=UPI0031E33AF8
MDLSVVPYTGGREEEAEGAGGGARYRECLRNHAAAMGGQAYDGCGEFMPAGEEDSLDALKCAACGCHRNFHRREGLSVAGPRPPLLLYGPGASAAAAAAWDHSKLGQQPPPPQFPAFLPAPMPLPYHAMQPPPLAAALPLPPCQEAGPDRACRVGSETPPRREEAAAEASGSRKRFRTRFTAEQKEKMQAFAEKLGWRVQKQDDVALDEFCLQIGVKRHVLKVWMHNNKSHLSSSSSSSSASHSATADPATRDAASASASASAPPIHA